VTTIVSSCPDGIQSRSQTQNLLEMVRLAT
jgi:hypothetical protein